MKYNGIIPLDRCYMFSSDNDEKYDYITEDIVPGVYPYYMISTFGNVYHRYREIIMKPSPETSGYLMISLSTKFGPKYFQIHRLVLMRFKPIQDCESLQVNHIDGNKKNNHLCNLEWVTRSENILHAYNNGLHSYGGTISEELATAIINLLKENKYQAKEIADMLGVSYSIVCDIKGKNSWNRLTKDIEFHHRKGRLYSEDDVKILCEFFQSNPKPNSYSIADYVYLALVECGFDNPEYMVDTARKIYGRKYYTNISKNYNF